MEDLLARCARAGLAVASPSDAAVHAGEVEVRRHSRHDVVQAREVTVAARAAAPQELRTLLVPRLSRCARPHRGADEWRTPLPPWGMRLARLLRGVRRTVGDVDLTVTWADDGRTCRLVAVAQA